MTLPDAAGFAAHFVILPSSSLSRAESDLAFLPPSGMLPCTKRAQVVRRHVRPNLTALNGPRILIESEVDPAEHARVVDVVREIVKRLVRETQAWHARMRELEANAMSPQKVLSNFTRGVAG